MEVDGVECNWEPAFPFNWKTQSDYILIGNQIPTSEK